MQYLYFIVDVKWVRNKKRFMRYFKSFVYDEPRAETCCEIGDYFMECNAYQRAIYWYQTAANTARRDTEGGFIQPDCYDYIPYMQMCVCYDKLEITIQPTTTMKKQVTANQMIRHIC